MTTLLTKLLTRKWMQTLFMNLAHRARVWVIMYMESSEKSITSFPQSVSGNPVSVSSFPQCVERESSACSLVWYEQHNTAEFAIEREKSIKGWERKWKLELIEKFNSEWNDLYHIICEDTGFPLKGPRE